MLDNFAHFAKQKDGISRTFAFSMSTLVRPELENAYVLSSYNDAVNVIDVSFSASEKQYSPMLETPSPKFTEAKFLSN